MKPLLLARGRLIDPRNGIDGVRDLLITEGKVSEVSEKPLAPPAGSARIDAAGQWVVPGLVDLHVHLREPGEEGKETILTGSRAAIAGGFTSVVAMPNTKPVNDTAQVTELIRRRAKEADLCRIYPAGAISKGLLGEEMAEMGELVAAGCVCVTDDGRPVMNAGLLRRVLQYAQQFRIPVMLHEEDLSLSGKGAMNEGHWSFRLGLPPIPASAEVSMVARDIVIAEETGGRMHIAHVSCEGSVRLLREAKRRGLAVTAEATPHHFSLNEERVGEYQTNAKMNPPLRNQRDVEAIREALVDGTVDAIATDHAPHGPLDKDVEFEKAMNGVVGLETAVGLTLELVHGGILSPRRAVELLSSGPAAAFGLPAGQLGKGAIADITLIDPDRPWTVEPSKFYSKSRNTPFGERALKGVVTHTLLAGRILYQNGKVVEANT